MEQSASSTTSYKPRFNPSNGGGRGSGGGFRRRNGGYSGGRRGYGRSGGFNRSRSGGRRADMQKIDVERFIAQSESKREEYVEFVPQSNFEQYDLTPEVLSNLAAKKYLQPTEIQEKTLPMTLEGRDIMGISSTGSGKTGAFLIPMVNKMLKDPKQKLLVLAPTRELAQQIENEAFSLVKYTGLRTATIIGGASMYSQIGRLRARPAIVVGTPGRVKDMFNRGELHLEEYNNLVLDEVDRMLDMGFVDEIKMLVSKMAPVRQNLFFSATMDRRVESISREISPNYEIVRLSNNQTARNVKQDVVRVTSYVEKIEKLVGILTTEQVRKSIIFIETKREVDKIERQLRDSGFKTGAIHGDKSQQRRNRVIDSFRRNVIQILIATNVAARGLDVSDITHVINFDEPTSFDDYIHRIGRTGRNGKEGNALTFVYR